MRTDSGSVVNIRRTGTGSLVDCSVYGGLISGLWWTVEYTDDLNWVCS